MDNRIQMKPKERINVGNELVRRLKSFNEILEKTDRLPGSLTCRTIRLQLEPKGYGGDDVKKVRKLLGVSQPLFAQFAGVSVASIRDWEQDIKPPSKPVCRLMDEIFHNPDYFKQRLRDLSKPVNAE
jgi:putative transcriptional regulator